MNRAPVTVVIPSYNSAEVVGEAIDSVLGQTLPAAQVVVVDDGSTDSTSTVLAGFGNRIEVVRQENRGLPGARNTGIREATQPLIGLLDADDAWLPGMVAAQVSEFAAAPETGLCFTDVSDCDETLHHPKPRGYRRRRAESVFEELYLEAFPIPPSSVFARRLVLEQAGLFDERMRMKQDLECWLRVAMRTRVSCIAMPLVLRRTHHASLTQSANPRRNLEFEMAVFERCGQAADAASIDLPMSVADRQVLALRRRVREFLSYGNRRAAQCYRDELRARNAWSASDTAAYLRGSIKVALFDAVRPITRRLRDR